MKPVTLAALVVAAAALGLPQLASSQSVKFRHVTSVYADDKGAALQLPEGVACGAQGRLVVADTGNDRLLLITFRDKAATAVSEVKIPELSAPSRVQLTSKGDILVLDAKRRRIVRLAPDGTFQGPLSLDGAPPPATIVPKAFTLDADDTLYVLDVFSGRVLVYNAEGTFQRTVPVPDGAGFISDVAVDVGGNLLVLDSIKRRLYSAARDATAFAPLGGDLESALLTLPSSMLATKGTILIAEGTGSSLVTIGRDGTFLARQLTMGWSEGALNHPAQICVNDQDEAFVADRDNSRIQVFGLIR